MSDAQLAPRGRDGPRAAPQSPSCSEEPGAYARFYRLSCPLS
jgi:hypothetical protein